MDHLQMAKREIYSHNQTALLQGQLHALIAIAEALQFPPRIVMGTAEGEH